MPRVAPIQNSFNGGELSPLLEGRTDFEKYRSGTYRCENFVPLVQGPAEFRPGLRAVAETKSRTGRSWLVPFHFNQTQSYALEFGEKYIRFFYQRGQLLASSGGAPYEITSQYTANDLITDDGCFKPSFAQSNDVMFMAHPKFYPQIVERYGHTDWDFRPFGFIAGSYTAYQLSFVGPMGSYNVERSSTLYASAQTGAVTLTAGPGSGPIFKDWMLGRFMILEQDPYGDDADPWAPGQVIAINDIRRVGARHYIATTAGTTGAVEPVHTAGTRSDGAVQWSFQHPGYGTVIITSIVDPSHANATVIMLLPGRVVGSTHPTPLFAFEAWNSNDGYPEIVCFFRERLCFARGSQIWMSSPGDFFNFADRDLNNEVTADQGISIQIASDTADPVRWMRETSQGLLIGTDGGEFMISESDPNSALAPDNVRCSKQSSYGSRAMAPISVEHAVLFVQRGGRKLRESVFDTLSETVKSRDLSVLSEHVTKSGITSMAFQQDPRSTMWLTRKDGGLLSFTYNVEQDVYGWHRHPLGNNAVAECVISIPSPDGQSDDLWVITSQTVSGKVYRFVQYLERGYQDGDDIRDAIYLDTALVWEGAATGGVDATVFPILVSWAGAQVYVVADGQPCGLATVSATGLVLQPLANGVRTGATRFVIGFPYRGVLGTMRLEAGSQDGTAQGKTKRIRELWMRFWNTIGGKVGPADDAARLEAIDFRTSADDMDAQIQPFTGDKRVPYPGDWETDGRVFVVQDQPLPMTVVAIMPRMESND